MPVTHACYNRMNKSADLWQPGPVNSCPYHGPRKQGAKQFGYKESAKDLRKKDTNAGVIGHDSGDGFYRDGPEV